MSKMLEFITKTVTANSEEDLDWLFDIANPTDDEKEMGEKYQSALGYNPITHFDQRKVEMILEDIVETFPQLGRIIPQNKETFVDNVLDAIDTVKPEIIASSIIDTLVMLDDSIDLSGIKEIICSRLEVELDEVFNDYDDDEIIGSDEDDDDESEITEEDDEY